MFKLFIKPKIEIGTMLWALVISLVLLGSCTTPSTPTAPEITPIGISKIIFESNRDRPGDHEIYVMDADGSNQRRLTSNPADDCNPEWSPDGSRIAFESDRDGDGEIYVMEANGSNQRCITNNPADDCDPDW